MMHWLIQELGEAAYLRLALVYGGTTLAVPDQPAGIKFGAMSVSIGKDAAIKLVQIAGGDRLYIARNAREERIQRNAGLRQQMTTHSVAEVARNFTYTAKLSERTLRKIKHAQDEDKQVNLWPD